MGRRTCRGSGLIRLLDGKIAIVTGAGRGIARRFVADGARVAVVEISHEHGRQVAQQLGEAALFIAAEISDKTHVERAVAETVAHFGGIDILVNNASAVTPNLLLEQRTDAMLSRTLGAGMWAT